MLALVLAAPFVLLICVGIVANIQRSIRTAQQREQLFQQRAQRNGSAGGLH